MITPLTNEEIDSAPGSFDDLGIIDLPDSLEGIEPGGAPPAQPEAPPGPTGPDEPPAHARKRGRPKGSKAQPPPAVPKITAGIRADINAKVSMPLEIAGQIWKARDGLCGGKFLYQRPAIADALTGIIIESPDLVAFFTGPGGKFMKYLELGAALWPVVEAVAAHHVYHSIEAQPDPAQPPQPAYAA